MTKNKAKCKLCKTIIEALSEYDYVSCKCGEIAVEGSGSLRVYANDLSNVLRLDDSGMEIIPKIIEKSDSCEEHVQKTPESIRINDKCIENAPKIIKEQLLKMLDDMIEEYQNKPPYAQYEAVTNFDLARVLFLIKELFKV